MSIKRIIIASLVLFFSVQTMAVAQSTNITEVFKKHFNETVKKVHEAENTTEKRLILNESFAKMITAINRIETNSTLNESEISQLNSFRQGITEKQNELNGTDGFNSVQDEDLDEFSNFAQDFMEQADRTVTIGVTTLLLILLILLLI